MTPSALSLRYLREQGYHPEVVEHWVPYTRRKRDLWGWCDILAVHEFTFGHPVAVQTTTKSNMAARIKKILASDTYSMVKASGICIHVHGWYKDERGHWQVKVTGL